MEHKYKVKIEYSDGTITNIVLPKSKLKKLIQTPMYDEDPIITISYQKNLKNKTS